MHTNITATKMFYDCIIKQKKQEERERAGEEQDFISEWFLTLLRRLTYADRQKLFCQ